MQNRIVVRYRDGRILKGNTADFLPTRAVFHVVRTGQAGSAIDVTEVRVADLKAVFFVRDFEGRPDYSESKTFEQGPKPQGRKIQVEFLDGEVLVGTTMGYQPDRAGFFLVPADPASNNERCFIVSTAVKVVTYL